VDSGHRSLDDQLEIERDRRRRVVAALLYGAEARPQTTAPDPWAPLVAGLAVVILLVLIVGIGTLVRASFPGARPAGGHPSPTATAPAR
jgi:hypothetical protein